LRKESLRDLKAEPFQCTNQNALKLFGAAAVKVVWSEVAVQMVILEHVKHNDQGRMSDGHYGVFVFAGGQAAELG
jgi:hypothetical protein